jgi:hypothetical protein
MGRNSLQTPHSWKRGSTFCWIQARLPKSLGREAVRYYSRMEFKQRTLRRLADMVCGNGEPSKPNYFKYRSSSVITEFFQDCETDYVHNGSTRWAWVSERLAEILAEPHPGPTIPPDTFCRVIMNLMDPALCESEGENRANALAQLNNALRIEGFEAFYAEDKRCYLRHIDSRTVAASAVNPHRPLSAAEKDRQEQLAIYLRKISEDEFIEHVLMPLFRQLGFHRVTAAGHEDKALEYGKDVWMRYQLPTQHQLYFGLQAKIGKIDSAGRTEKGNANVAELLNQVNMMLGHEVFDPETNKKHLPDHAFVVSGGTITKAARNWLAGSLDKSKRSQLIFMDRDDILNLYIVSSLPLPKGALPPASAKSDFDDDIPF